jgi:hypothetical protein
MNYKQYQHAKRSEIMQKEDFGPKAATELVVWQEEHPEFYATRNGSVLICQRKELK